MKHFTIATFLALVVFGPVLACADGPDTYRVRGVAADDALNARSGPGLEFSVIGVVPHDAINLRNLDSVPVHACDGGASLTAYEQANHWTKVYWKGAENSALGWVKSSFLAE